MIRKWLIPLLAIVIFALIHEGAHAIMAMIFGEYQAFKIHPYGLEVIFKTEVAQRSGMHWGFISGMSNLITIGLGYLLFSFRKHLAAQKMSLMGSVGYWLIILFMLMDTLNLSVGPFIYGGDIGGIVRGFGINALLVQAVMFIAFLINRELIACRLLPLYGIKTRHPFFQPWFLSK